MITAEEARNNDQLYFSNSYKTALSLYLKPEDNYSELIDLINRSVGKQSRVGKYAVVVTLTAGRQQLVREDVDVLKAISFLKENFSLRRMTKILFSGRWNLERTLFSCFPFLSGSNGWLSATSRCIIIVFVTLPLRKPFN